ncbi:MAG: hypothetical protein ABIS12_17980 [Bacteroidia bacterium]
MKRFNLHLFITFSLAPLLLGFGTIAWTTITQAEYTVAMDKMNEFYTVNDHYSVRISYSSFRGHESEVPYETSNGIYICDKNKYYSQLLGTRTIQNEKIKIVIDSLHKSITVANPEENESGNEMKKINYENSKQYITAYKTAPIANGKLYRIECNPTPSYSAYVLDLSNDGFLRELIVYYKNEYPIDPTNATSAKAKAKLKISYSGFDSKTAFDPARVFSTAKYITETSGKLTLTKAYSSYRLFDNRIPNKK